MKLLLIICITALLSACAHQNTSQNTTTISYSGPFQISLPSNFMDGSTVFYSGEIGVKQSSGHVLIGKALSPEEDDLPESFDMRLYPEYLLRIRPTTDLSDEDAKRFYNSSIDIDNDYDLNSLDIKKDDNKTIYSLCKQNNCYAMIVKNNFQEHIFYVYTQGIGKTEFTEILNGGLNVR